MVPMDSEVLRKKALQTSRRSRTKLSYNTKPYRSMYSNRDPVRVTIRAL